MRIFHNGLIAFVVVVVGFAVCGPLFTCATRTREKESHAVALPEFLRTVGRGLRTVAMAPVHFQKASWRFGKRQVGAALRPLQVRWAKLRGKHPPFAKLRLGMLENLVPTIEGYLLKDLGAFIDRLNQIDKRKPQEQSLWQLYNDCVFGTTAAALLLWDVRPSLKNNNRYDEAVNRAKSLVVSMWTEFRSRYRTEIGTPSLTDENWRAIGPEQTVDETVRYIVAVTWYHLPDNWKEIPRQSHEATTAEEVYPWKYYWNTDGAVIERFTTTLITVAKSLSSEDNAGVRTPPSPPVTSHFNDAIVKIFTANTWEMSPQMPGWFNFHITSTVFKKVLDPELKQDTPANQNGRLFLITVLTWWWLAVEGTKTKGQRASLKWMSSFRSKLAVCLKHFAGRHPWEDFDAYKDQVKTFTLQIDQALKSIDLLFSIDLSDPLIMSIFTLEKAQFDAQFTKLSETARRKSPVHQTKCDSAEILGDPLA